MTLHSSFRLRWSGSSAETLTTGRESTNIAFEGRWGHTLGVRHVRLVLGDGPSATIVGHSTAVRYRQFRTTPWRAGRVSGDGSKLPRDARAAGARAPRAYTCSARPCIGSPPPRHLRWLGRVRRGCLIVIMAAMAIAAAAPRASAAATNGRIAFEQPPDSQPAIETINADASGLQPVPRVPRNSANPAWSADGNRLAFTSTSSGRTQVYTINLDGSNLNQITTDPVAATDPTWSPAGNELAFTSWRTGTPDIWTVSLDTGVLTQLTSGSGINQQPRWSPDGNLIAFASNRTGAFEIYTMAPDGSAQQAITSRAGDNTDPAWSPVGDQLAYTNTLNAVRQIYAIGRTGGGDRQLTSGAGSDQFPAWSPDGTKIVFTRGSELSVMAAAGEAAGGPATAIGVSGVDPVWAPAPPLVAQRKKGTVTATAPGSGTTQVTSPTTVATGTVVDATHGSAAVMFKPLAAPLSMPPSTAVVRKTKVTLTDRTTRHVTLTFAPPRCGTRHGASIASPVGPHSGYIRGGGFRPKSNHVSVDVKDPVYWFGVACRGTTITVKAGAVNATVINTRLPTTVTLTIGHRPQRIVLQRGHRPTVRVRAGASLFVPN